MTNTTDTPTKYDFTAEDIAAARDEELLSWAKVAQRLGLGSPGAARRAYTALVRPHTESVLPGRTSGGSDLTPITVAGLDLEHVRESIVGKTITVQRSNGKTEAIHVERVTSLKGDTINFNDGAKSRSVKAEAVIATK